MNVFKKNTSYEIQTRSGSIWNVHDVYYDEKIASHEALMLWNGGQHTAVRVACEKMDPSSSTFTSKIIQHYGAKDSGAKIGSDYVSRPCWTLEDIYKFEGRQTIGSLLSEVLKRWNLTPAELLHHPDHYFRLDRAGTTMQSAVQRAAVQQVKTSGQSVQERMKVLYDIIGQGIGRLSKLYKKSEIPDIVGNNIEGLISKIANNKQRDFVLSCVLANHLKDNTTIDDKLSSLLELVRPDHPEWVIGVADMFISGFINHAPVVHELLGEQENLGATLLEMARLAGGKSLVVHDTADGQDRKRLVRINSMLAGRELPDTRLVLLGRIVKELEGGRKLVSEDLEDELEAIHAIAKVLTGQSNRHADTAAVMDALATRAGRFMTEYHVASYIKRAQTPVQAIGMILDLEPMVEGDEGKRKLANFIMPIVRAQEHVRFFEAADGRHMERMRQIAHLQERVSKSGLVHFHKQRVMTKLDDYCMELITKEKVFDRSQDARTLGQKLLKMLVEGYFTRGEALKLAQKETRRLLREPGFIENYVSAGTEEDKKRKLITLKTALTRTGLSLAPRRNIA